MLAPLAFAFGAVVRVRRLLYRRGVLSSERVGLPVIIAGNITAGGSGKTPLVLWLADLLLGAGYRPGLVSRGHAGRISSSSGAPAQVHPDSDPALVGDEPLLLARRSGCPVWVGSDRVAACRALRASHPDCDVIVLDDGLQHYRLARDIEIAVVDARGFGNGRLLPAGPLREPASRLAEVDAVVCNGGAHVAACAGLQGYAMSLEGSDFAQLVAGGRTVSADGLGAKRVHAVAGMGDPPRFFRHLASLGLEVVPHPFADHHRFEPADLEFGDDAPVVMTEKDAVKCAPFAQPRFWVLPVHAELDPGFGAFVIDKLRSITGGDKLRH